MVTESDTTIKNAPMNSFLSTYNRTNHKLNRKLNTVILFIILIELQKLGLSYEMYLYSNKIREKSLNRLKKFSKHNIFI